MKTDFYDLIEDEIGSSVTENGAVGYRSSGKALLDLNFAVSSLRDADESEIIRRFGAAYEEDAHLAVIWLFFARDVRGGMGERRLFRVCMRWMAENHPEIAIKVLPLLPFYGRWDDLISLLGTKVHHAALRIVGDRFYDDLNAPEHEPITLLGKWLPSECSKVPEKRRQARFLMEHLAMKPRQYRRALSYLRKKLDIVERRMSAGEWDEISYPSVPSRANLIYNEAFLRHDEDRRRDFLSDVSKGEAKINASVLFPHDIVHKYRSKATVSFHLGHPGFVCDEDEGLEALWNALPDAVPEGGGTIVVADGSGSMVSNVGNTGVTALDVANALAIYFAERLPKPFRNKYITFSMKPKFVDLSGCKTLAEKICEAWRHDECANTNIEAVFRLLLTVAVCNRLTPNELPKNILILSDMEFDACGKKDMCLKGESRRGLSWWEYENSPAFDEPLFKSIEKDWAQHGYKLPRLVFWNVMSRTGTIPVRENEMGVALVSGFSTNVAKMVMSAKLDPMEALIETLDGERYDPVRQALS